MIGYFLVDVWWLLVEWVFNGWFASHTAMSDGLAEKAGKPGFDNPEAYFGLLAVVLVLLCTISNAGLRN